MNELRDRLISAGVAVAEPYRKGDITAHEIHEVVGVARSNAGRIMEQLLATGEYTEIMVRHPKTGRPVKALRPIEQQQPKKRATGRRKSG